MKNPVADIIVVGGGASGMMAAITAARCQKKVVILEHNDILGKKILATGNGRCNFTNSEQGEKYYRSDSPAFVLPSLELFDAGQTIHFFEELGIMTAERQGYYYPRTMQASAIRNALLNELKRLQVKVYTEIGIRQIRKEKDQFLLDTKSGTFSCKKCILAAGGKADPKSGSDGSGYIYAKQLGHHLTETVPALVPLLSDAKWLKAVKGVRQEARVSLHVNEKLIFADQGEVQFTDYGVSGIPVFQISRFAAKALLTDAVVNVHIDFAPDAEKADLTHWIEKGLEHFKYTGTIQDILGGIVNQKFAEVLAYELPFAGSSLAKLSAKQKELLTEKTVALLKDTKIAITGTKPFVQAQVTAGGIDVSEVHPSTMESKKVPGLYFAGEILDVDGMCGGYNLQWAWSSGYLAGKHAAENENR